MTEHAAPRRRSWRTWVGGALIVAGLAVLGWVAWQYWGTTWVSHRDQERIVAEVRDQWEIGAAPVVGVPEGDVGAVIRIPRFGDEYAVPVLEGTSEEVLANGFGHFEGTAGPGQVGNYALAGHRVTHGEPLRDMPKLEVGDQVIVETRNRTFTYELTTAGDALEVPFTETWVLAALPDNPDPGEPEPDQEQQRQRLITLTTCAELFHTDNRLIAFGVLVDSERKPASRAS